MINTIQTDLPLKKNHVSLIHVNKWNTLTNCYSVFRFELFENLVNLRLSFFEVFNPNFNILNVLR